MSEGGRVRAEYPCPVCGAPVEDFVCTNDAEASGTCGYITCPICADGRGGPWPPIDACPHFVAVYVMGDGIPESAVDMDEIYAALPEEEVTDIDEPDTAFELVARIATSQGGRVLQSSMDSQGMAGIWEWRTIFAPDVDALRTALDEELRR